MKKNNKMFVIFTIFVLMQPLITILALEDNAIKSEYVVSNANENEIKHIMSLGYSEEFAKSADRSHIEELLNVNTPAEVTKRFYKTIEYSNTFNSYYTLGRSTSTNQIIELTEDEYFSQLKLSPKIQLFGTDQISTSFSIITLTTSAISGGYKVTIEVTWSSKPARTEIDLISFVNGADNNTFSNFNSYQLFAQYGQIGYPQKTSTYSNLSYDCAYGSGYYGYNLLATQFSAPTSARYNLVNSAIRIKLLSTFNTTQLTKPYSVVYNHYYLTTPQILDIALFTDEHPYNNNIATVYMGTTFGSVPGYQSHYNRYTLYQN